MILAVQPSALLDRPEMASVAKTLRDNQTVRPAAPPPAETIDQLVVFWEGMPEGPTGPGRAPTFVPPPSGVIIRWLEPVAWDKVDRDHHPVAPGSRFTPARATTVPVAMDRLGVALTRPTIGRWFWPRKTRYEP